MVTSGDDENDSRKYHNVSRPLQLTIYVQQSSAKMVRKAIIDLFLNVKIRSHDQISAMTEDKIEQEKNKLKGTDTIDIIDYVK